MAYFNLKSKSVSVNARRIIPARDDEVPSALFRVGLVTAVLAVAAAFSWGPEGALALHPGIYWEGALLGGFLTIVAAVSVSDDLPRRAGYGRLILCFSYVPFVVALVISGFDLNITDLF